MKIENKKIETYEDLNIWQDARAPVAASCKASLGEPFYRDFVLRDQIRRASGSIMSNIAEGFERSSHKDVVRFLTIAKASAAEVRPHLYGASDLGYISSTSFETFLKQMLSLSKQLAGFIKYFERRQP